MAQCNLCATDFSISPGGRKAVRLARRHQESLRHGQNEVEETVCSSLLVFRILLATQAPDLLIS